MNLAIGRAQIGQWYTNLDTGNLFFVTAFDQKSRTIEIQTRDGDVAEIDLDAWGSLPLELAEQPEEETQPSDELDNGYLDDLNSPVEKIALGGGIGD